MSQSLPLKDQLKALEQLQEIDLKIDSLVKQRDEFPLQLKSLQETERKSRSSVESKQSQLTEIEKAQRQTQAAIELNQDRLSRSTARLETVQNSQEYQAVSKEIDQLKKMNSELEAQLGQKKAEADQTQKEISELQSKLGESEKEREAKAGEIDGEVAKLDASINSLNQEKAEHLAAVEKRILSQYDRIRAGRNGLGIVPAVAGRCKGCNMILPPQLYNQVQRGTELQQCPSCFRLLFAPSS